MSHAKIDDISGELAEPEVLNARYKVLRQIGRGGQGRTLLAEDLQTQTQVVLKELDFGHIDRLKILDLFEREARVLKQIDHPEIPAYLDEFHVQTPAGHTDRYFLVQSYIAGQNLRVQVEQGRIFDEAKVRQILAELLEILDYLHTQNPPIIHRDIKPSNIILRQGSDAPVLVDFGGVQQKIIAENASSTIVGTSGFMPTEQLMGRAIPSSDLYALGATAAYLLSRRSPDQMWDEDMTIAFEQFVNISPAFANYLKKLLAPFAPARFQTAAEALHFLQNPETLPPTPDARAEQQALVPAEPRALTFEWPKDEKKALIDRANLRKNPKNWKHLTRQSNIHLPGYVVRGGTPIVYRSPRPERCRARVRRTHDRFTVRLLPRSRAISRALWRTALNYWFFIFGAAFIFVTLLISLRGGATSPVLISAIATLGLLAVGLVYLSQTQKNLVRKLSRLIAPSLKIVDGKISYLKDPYTIEDSRLIEFPVDKIKHLSILYARRGNKARNEDDPAMLPPETGTRYCMEIYASPAEHLVIEEDIPLDEQFYILGELWAFLNESDA